MPRVKKISKIKGKGVVDKTVNKVVEKYNKVRGKKQDPRDHVLKNGENHVIMKNKDGALVRAQFAGPGTDLVGNLKKLLDEAGGSYDKALSKKNFVSDVDRIALLHDSRYALEGDNPDRVRRADEKMVSKIKDAEKAGESKFNTLPSKLGIQAKIKLSDWGIMKKDAFAQGGSRDEMTDEEIAVVQGAIDWMEQKGYGKIRPMRGGADGDDDKERKTDFSDENNITDDELERINFGSLSLGEKGRKITSPIHISSSSNDPDLPGFIPPPSPRDCQSCFANTFDTSCPNERCGKDICFDCIESAASVLLPDTKKVQMVPGKKGNCPLCNVATGLEIDNEKLKHVPIPLTIEELADLMKTRGDVGLTKIETADLLKDADNRVMTSMRKLNKFRNELAGLRTENRVFIRRTGRQKTARMSELNALIETENENMRKFENFARTLRFSRMRGVGFADIDDIKKREQKKRFDELMTQANAPLAWERHMRGKGGKKKNLMKHTKKDLVKMIEEIDVMFD